MIPVPAVPLPYYYGFPWDDWFDEEVDKAYEELYFLRRYGEAGEDE
jgi:hypothetical protein